MAIGLLKRALDIFLDEEDPLCTIVLAGAAEDILEGLLRRAGLGKEAARPAAVARALEALGYLDGDPDAKAMGEQLRGAFRNTFNWTRHANRPAEPLELMQDWHDEAAWTLVRALDNMEAWCQELPARADEFWDVWLA